MSLFTFQGDEVIFWKFPGMRVDVKQYVMHYQNIVMQHNKLNIDFKEFKVLVENNQLIIDNKDYQHLTTYKYSEQEWTFNLHCKKSSVTCKQRDVILFEIVKTNIGFKFIINSDNRQWKCYFSSKNAHDSFIITNYYCTFHILMDLKFYLTYTYQEKYLDYESTASTCYEELMLKRTANKENTYCSIEEITDIDFSNKILPVLTLEQVTKEVTDNFANDQMALDIIVMMFNAYKMM
jgi:hypothetical protein